MQSEHGMSLSGLLPSVNVVSQRPICNLNSIIASTLRGTMPGCEEASHHEILASSFLGILSTQTQNLIVLLMPSVRLQRIPLAAILLILTCYFTAGALP